MAVTLFVVLFVPPAPTPPPTEGTVPPSPVETITLDELEAMLTDSPGPAPVVVETPDGPVSVVVPTTQPTPAPTTSTTQPTTTTTTTTTTVPVTTTTRPLPSAGDILDDLLDRERRT